MPPARAALPVTLLVNVLMALPFCLRVLAPAWARAEADHGRLADQLGLRGLPRLRWLILPRIRGPLGFAAGIAAALSMGDLGVITLFGTEDRETLPLLMYRLMGAYRPRLPGARRWFCWGCPSGFSGSSTGWEGRDA